MDDNVNIWLFPIQEEILVTDQTGGVPVDCCNLSEHYEDRLQKLTGSKSVLYTFNEWSKATDFAKILNGKTGWEVKYDNWYGRQVEAEMEDYDN